MKYHLILFLLMNIIPSLLFAKQPALTHQSISERNIKIVTEFYSAAFNQLSYPKAAQYMGEKYIQHSSHVQDGKMVLNHSLICYVLAIPMCMQILKKLFLIKTMSFYTYILC